MATFHFFWSMLEDKKQGSSDHIDRIDLIEQFIKCFGKDRIECVIGDSEFIGKNWIEWLKEENIEYVMCLRNSQNIANSEVTPIDQTKNDSKRETFFINYLR